MYLHYDILWRSYMFQTYTCFSYIYHIYIYTVRCRCNAANIPPSPHKIHPIARPEKRDVGGNLLFDTLIYMLLQSTQSCMKYHVILDRITTTLDSKYPQSSNMSNKIVQMHHPRLKTWLQWIGKWQLQDETRNIQFGDLVRLILEFWMYMIYTFRVSDRELLQT